MYKFIIFKIYILIEKSAKYLIVKKLSQFTSKLI
jgi:hypothetical protein